MTKSDLIKINEWLWEIPKTYSPGMRVPARIYSSEEMLEAILSDRSLAQLVNVTMMPGIYKYALVMPDVHEGYGFPIGGVAAFDLEEGIISPGGIGYDINCGVRLLRSELTFTEVKPHLKMLSQSIYQEVPSGVGRSGRLVLKGRHFDELLKKGAAKIIELGYGQENDLTNVESHGSLADANEEVVSKTAKARGRDQLGTLGAGNHFVEVEKVETIFDNTAADKLKLSPNQIVILIHTGSRGFGHQIATDYIHTMIGAMPKYDIVLPDRELAYAPLTSYEGKNYRQAMAAAANFAWANRQMITWEVRQAWNNVFGKKAGDTLQIVYDVSHNIAKIEEYDGKKMIVHRKGATRAFPGQPVLIPGSMGTGSYILVGQDKSLAVSFGSSCHGAGRRMSRSQAKREISGFDLKKELESRGIIINEGSIRGLAEEAPQAYKDVDQVVDVVHNAGIATKVARLTPLAVIKG